MEEIKKPEYVSPRDSKKIFLINDDVRAMYGVYEPNGKKELFKTFDMDIRVGDICVVPTTTRYNVTTIKVVEADVEFDFENSETAHWIIHRVDPDHFKGLVKREQDALATIRQAELRKQRETLRNAIFENQADVLKTIDLAKVGSGLPAPETPPKVE